MPRFSRRNNKRYKKVITRRKKNRFTRKYGVKNGVKNGGSAPAMVILKNEPLVWSFKTN
jgi:hypothetical protein